MSWFIREFVVGVIYWLIREVVVGVLLIHSRVCSGCLIDPFVSL